MGSNRINFLQLPTVVLHGLVDYLDSSSIKTLRLVNHACKSWVEEKEYQKCFQKFVIRVDDEQSVDEKILTCSIKCSNLIVDEVPMLSLIALLQHCQPWLKTIQIRRAEAQLNFEDFTQILLNIGPQLEQLCIISTFGYFIPDEGDFDNFVEESSEILQENLRGLKDLKFPGVLEQCLLEPLEFASILEHFLRLCPNLVTLGLPTFYWNRKADQYTEEDLCFQSNQPAQALIGFLQDISRRPCSLKSIDFHSCEKQDDSDWLELHTWPFIMNKITKMSEITLLELGSLCAPLSIKLFNVLTDELPLGMNLRQGQRGILDKCLKSVVFIGNNFEIADKYIPPECEVKVVLHVTSDTSFELDLLPPALKVTTLRMTFPPLMGGHLQHLTDFFGVVRPTLVNLKIESIPSYLLESLELGTSFPNLKTVWISANPANHDVQLRVDEDELVGGLGQDLQKTFTGFILE